jgi:dTDP-4-amino-4,6-dideoxygalactose transaminase
MRPSVGDEELAQVKQVLDSGWLAQGPKVKEFERMLAEYLGARHVLATSSCTTALALALESISIKPGSEVVVPDFTFPATGNVVLREGHNLGLVDVTPKEWSMDLGLVAKRASKKTKCIMPVHPFGHPLDEDELYEMASSHGLDVIEDAATAIGAKHRGMRVGRRGKAVCFSFHPRKILTTGEGGCLATDDDEVHERALALRNHGQVMSEEGYSFIYNANNYRMSDIQAAVGVAQLAKMDRMIEKRRKMAHLYNELLEGKRLPLDFQADGARSYSTFQSYVVRLRGSLASSRKRITKSLKEKYRIETQLGTYSLHAQPAFRKARRLGRIVNGPRLFRESLTLPLYDSLTEDEQRYIVDSLVKVAGTI